MRLRRFVLVGAVGVLTACSSQSSPTTNPSTAPPVTTTAPASTSTSTTATTPAAPTALPSDYTSVCAVVPATTVAKAMQIVSAVVVGPSVEFSGEPPLGDRCLYTNEQGRLIVSVTVGAATVDDNLAGYVASLDKLGAKPAPVDGLGFDATGIQVLKKIAAVQNGRPISVDGPTSGVTWDEVKAAAKVLVPAVPKASVPSPKIELPECARFAEAAAKVVGAVTARRDYTTKTGVRCGFGSSASAVTVTTKPAADAKTDLKLDESTFGPAPISGVPDSYYGQGSGVVVTATTGYALNLFPTGDDAAAVALLKQAASGT